MSFGTLGTVAAACLAFGCVPPQTSPTPSAPARRAPTTFDHSGSEVPASEDLATASPTSAPLPEPPTDQRGTITTRDDGTCWYSVSLECARGAPCNPPPPTQVECPAGDASGSR